MPTPTPATDYRKAAIDKFNLLKISYDAPIAKNGASYWKFGNSFDTIIDFLALIDSSKANDVANMVKKQYDASLAALGGYDAAWFDDFGWWTIAAQRAAKQSFFSQEAQKNFKGIVQNCWKRFTENAPFVWDRHDPKTFSNCRPAVDEGVWNGYWINTDPKWKGPKSGDPSSGKLEGIQNTVTNCVYLIAAQRLGVNDPQAKDAARKEFRFLHTWFTKQPNQLWWFQQIASTALVHERASHFFYADGTPKDKIPAAPGFKPHWVWTGDQGLILGGLVDRILLMGVGPDERAELLNRAKQLLAGVRQSLVDGDNKLKPYSNEEGAPDGDIGDYETGTGVFWRYFLHAWTVNPDVKVLINQPEYQRFLRASAEFAAKSPTEGQTFDELTNDVSVLVAATQILH